MDDTFGCEDEAYRTCVDCGGDCEPEPMLTDEGMRIAFGCPTHAVHTVLDLFEDLR